MSQSAGEPRWEHFEHEADVGVRGIGATLERAFEQAAIAMTAVITNPTSVRPERKIEIACTAPDPDQLFLDWLNAIVYEMATRSMLFGRFEVTTENGSLRGAAWGEPVDVSRHHPAVEVKAATYMSLRVGEVEGGVWIAQCVIDV